MEVTMATEAPALVVHTTVAQKTEENAGILDGMWACLLNDYLDNLGDTEEEEEETSSDANSISTTALRAERRRLRKLKKCERRKELMKGLLKDISDPSAILEDSSEAVDRQLLQNLESDAYSKGVLLDIASKSFDVTKKEKNSRDKHGPLPTTFSEERTQNETIRTNHEVKSVLKQAASFKSASLRGSNVQTKMIDTDDGIVRSHLSRDTDTESIYRAKLDPMGRKSMNHRSRRELPDTSLGENGFIHIGSEKNPIDIEEPRERTKWHSKRELLPNANKKPLHASYHGRRANLGSDDGTNGRLRLKLEPTDTLSPTQKNIQATLQKLREPMTRSELLTATRLEKYPKDTPVKKHHALVQNSPVRERLNEGVELRTETRDAEENVWALEEFKRSQLDEIRQKKLDRKEALMRIRAIKARIEKIET